MGTLLVVWVVCAILGALIGEAKGRRLEGAALGGLLGLFGLLILALLPKRASV